MAALAPAMVSHRRSNEPLCPNGQKKIRIATADFPGPSRPVRYMGLPPSIDAARLDEMHVVTRTGTHVSLTTGRHNLVTLSTHPSLTPSEPGVHPVILDLDTFRTRGGAATGAPLQRAAFVDLDLDRDGETILLTGECPITETGEWGVLVASLPRVRRLMIDSAYHEHWDDDGLTEAVRSGAWPLESLVLGSASATLASPELFAGLVPDVAIVLTSAMRFEGPSDDEFSAIYTAEVAAGRREQDWLVLDRGGPVMRYGDENSDSSTSESNAQSSLRVRLHHLQPLVLGWLRDRYGDKVLTFTHDRWSIDPLPSSSPPSPSSTPAPPASAPPDTTPPSPTPTAPTSPSSSLPPFTSPPSHPAEDNSRAVVGGVASLPSKLRSLAIVGNDAIDTFQRLFLARPGALRGLHSLTLRSIYHDFGLTPDTIFAQALCAMPRLRHLHLTLGVTTFRRSNSLLVVFQRETLPPDLEEFSFRGPVSLSSTAAATFADALRDRAFLPRLRQLSFVLDLTFDLNTPRPDADGLSLRPDTQGLTEVQLEVRARIACDQVWQAARERGVSVVPFTDPWGDALGIVPLSPSWEPIEATVAQAA